MADGWFASGDVLVWAGVTAVRATLVLAGAFALAGLLRRASASVHHALWTVTLVSLLVLPALPLVLPQVPVPVPDGWLPETAVARVPGLEARGTGMPGLETRGTGMPWTEERGKGTPGTGARKTGMLWAEGREARPAPVRGGGGTAPPAAAGARESPAKSDVARPEAEIPAEGLVEGRIAEGVTSPKASGAAQEGATWEVATPEPAWLLLIWIPGAGALALSLALGLWRSSRVWRAARPAREEAWLHDLEGARAAVGMERPVSLRFSGGVRTGMAGGLVRALVLLPDTARAWTAGRREMVLLHELVHLRRRDPLRKVLGRLALALYWFHPLAWCAARAAALAREEACDDAVVALGHRPSAYARHLLDLADRARLPLPALARIDRPPLEKRIMRLLRSPSVSSSRTVTLASVLALSWVVLVSALAPVARAAEPAEPAAQDTVQAPPPLPQIVPLAPPVAEPPAALSPVPLPPGAAPVLLDPAPAVRPAPVELIPPPVPTALPALPTLIPPPDTTGACRPELDGAGFVHGEGLSMRGNGFATLGSDDWLIQREVGGVMLCARAHGTGDPADLGAGEIDLPSGSWMVLASRDEAVSQRLEMLPGASGPEHTWFVNGEARPFNATARAWRDAMLDVVRSAAALSAAQRQDARLGEEAVRDVSEQQALLRNEIAVVQRQQEGVERELARARAAAEARQEEVVAQVLAARERLAAQAPPEIRRLEASLSAMRGAMEVLDREQARERLRMAMEEVERAIETMRERADSGRTAAAETRAALEATAATSREELAVLQARMQARDSIMAMRSHQLQAAAAARTAVLRDALEGLDTARADQETRVRMDALGTREVEELERRLQQAETRLLELIRRIR